MNAINTEERLESIAHALRSGEKSPIVTVRSFLSWFLGYQRRSQWIVSYIRDKLADSGLRTEPDFEATYLDGEIHFALVDNAGEQSAQTDTSETVETVTISEHTEVRVVSNVFADPTYRVSKLAAANRVPLSVQPDSPLTEAVTRMLANDFSQLPVMTSEREVRGVVSWETIGT